MQVKRITARNMRLALQAVREQLGPDAVILSNKRVGNTVELLCSLEPQTQTQAQTKTTQESQPLQQSQFEQQVQLEQQTQTASSPNSASAMEQAAIDQIGDVNINDMGSIKSALSKLGSKVQRRQPNNEPELTDEYSHEQAENPQSINTQGMSRLEKELSIQNETLRQRAQEIERRLAQKRFQESRSSQSDTAQVENVESNEFDQGFHSDLAELESVRMSAPQFNDSHFDRFQQASQASALEVANLALEKQRQDANEQIASLREELSSMRQLFQMQWEGMGWNRYCEQDPQRAEFWRRLSQIGLESSTIKTLLDTADFAPVDMSNKQQVSENWDQLIELLTYTLDTCDQESILTGGVHAFVGPTGVGKTTTIGKLAARYVLANGNQDIVLISTDTYRIAAHDQLKAIGRILDVPVHILDKPDMLPDMLKRYRNKSLVLIDTAGLGANQDKQSEQLTWLSSLQDTIQTWLLLSATAQFEVLENTLNLYKEAQVTGCILTKVDEAPQLGAALSIISESGLALHSVTDGQKIPDDLHHADAKQLVGEALKRTRDDVNEEVLAMDFAELARGQRAYNQGGVGADAMNLT